ncbi:hypothetical protein P0082_09965 [Candidatus Haliotispira prima]|uniref:Uncharacterized protein n=1 Tax=Candidatus Haliotispira prima TaxID=3034016 RepID=A0ABY8MGX1_9SPIO|nr:hypothetical protein P0082_09965 [Candidatus Haliotispira prima]
MKSSTCFKKNGEPKVVYSSEDEAKVGADYAKSNYSTHLIPYHCKECGDWHLSPPERRTPSFECGCTDRSGGLKQCYHTREDAEKRANILREEKKVILQVYSCDYGKGYHLTKG